MCQTSLITELTEGIAETGTESIARLRRTPDSPGMLTRERLSQQCGGIIVLTQQQTILEQVQPEMTSLKRKLESVESDSATSFAGRSSGITSPASVGRRPGRGHSRTHRCVPSLASVVASAVGRRPTGHNNKIQFRASPA